MLFGPVVGSVLLLGLGPTAGIFVNGATESLFSESELLAHAGLAYGGSDTLESELGAPLESFIEDFHTVFTDGFEGGDTSSWSSAVP